jgi:FtsP/CotA-like multicopper oxidase with cupredoxin domain
MKKKIFKGITHLGLVLIAVAMLAGPSSAADITADLTAVVATWLPPGGTAGEDEITMWGFVNDTGGCPTTPPDWSLGPRISAQSGDNLTINLRNCLSEAVSILIPGQNAALNPVRNGGGRVTSFTNVTPVGGATTVSYTWNNLKEGTYLYHSGTNMAKQVPMGLYGALIVNVSPGRAYNTTDPVDYDNEVVLFSSEIDPALHDPTPAFAHPSDYHPTYFLVNGKSYPDASLDPLAPGDYLDHAIETNERVLVRMLSAALDDVVPTINGMHWDIIAEDGNRYPYPKEQYTALLSPMKTRDAILVPTMTGTYPVFDRRLNLTNDAATGGGMLVQLAVGLSSTPTVNITAPLDGSSFVTATAVTFSGNASDAEDGDLSANLSWESNIDGSLGPPGASVTTSLLTTTGTHVITASATDSNSNTGSDSITVIITDVNTPPVVTITGPATTTFDEGTPVTFTGTAIDPEDGDISANLSWTSDVGGAIGTGASVTTSTLSPGSHGITASVTDSGGLPGSATINITINDVNLAPVANPDFATTTRNTPITIDLTSNDDDPDGNLDPTSVIVTGEELIATGWVAPSSRGGTVTNLKNGSVVYEPRRNFRGTDTFTYTVGDTDGERSAQATVQVNVVK